MYLLVEDDDEKIRDGDLQEHRFVYTYNEREEPLDRLSGTAANDLSQVKMAYNANGNEYIAVDIGGDIYSHSAGDRDEESLPINIKGSKFRTVYTGVKTIGESIYAIGIPRLLYKRNGINNWKHLSESIPLPIEYIEKKATKGKYGWNDLDGYSEQNIYLVGGTGDVWNFDGEEFKQLDFPSNETLENVCCASDGNVYIGGRRGRIWKGKDDTWELISEEEFSIPWKDIVWFNDRLFLGSDYGLWEYKDGEVIDAEVPDQVRTCSGSLSICPEKKYLLTAGNNGASMYDGKEWTVLFDRFELED